MISVVVHLIVLVVRQIDDTRTSFYRLKVVFYDCAYWLLVTDIGLQL